MRYTPPVNMLAPPRALLAIAVVFDLICPWSYLGVRRLRECLARRTDISPVIEWRPFLLNPGMERGSAGQADHIIHRFGTEDRTQRLHRSITELGRREGISFRFDLIKTLPPSFDAHRLVRWVAEQAPAFQLSHCSAGGGGFNTSLPACPDDAAGGMVERLFAACFTEGRNIGDLDELARIAAEAGFSRTDALTYLLGPEGRSEIQLATTQAHRIGITGVPCFVFDHHHAIAGAQEPHVIDRLLDVTIAALETASAC
ncbi:FrnE protein [Granulibacter bethesdensis]|uniref:FrnE protein n=1 Tax=Granulibacter bethesdensis TaxID=364410 RepID=A0AAC9P894_9PROT|nr:DsbA family oxidoreductase [Granulibacter bethesdensis]APH54272.1 FrnE protein [Granulibacter bethesdensis]APH61857.1 FrnE protein [Granulibacter bethesdensis]